MKKLSFLPILAALLMLVASSCTKDKCKTRMTYVKYEPLYLSASEFRIPIEVESGRTLKNPGKIYLYRNYILINERQEGIHVIDNSNPASPQNVAFIKIPGNIDMAVKGNVLYADNYVDLLAIDITEPTQATILRRVQDAFPNYGFDNNGNICVAYIGKEVTEDVVCNTVGNGGWGNPWQEDVVAFTQTTNTAGVSGSAGANSARSTSGGVGGSMARFTISNDYLYTVDFANLHVFDITTLDNPVERGQTWISWGNVETVFPYEDKLFIGSSNGLYIYSISNPTSPTYMSEFSHANACDPVYVDGNFAYVTLRSGTECDDFNNQLDVIDISNINSPTLMASHMMHNPHGLSVKDNFLYLCDGTEGIKVFNASDKTKIGSNLLFQDKSIPTYDVIASPFTNILLVVGAGGFYQYDNTNPASLVRISHIPVER